MWQYNTLPDTDELYHYGILGMKWGVRRSEAQLARARGKSNSDNEYSEDHKRTHGKAISEMSDSELNATVNRLRNEKAYQDLNPKKVSLGKRIADKLLKTAGDVALEVGKNVAKDYLTNKAKDKLGLNVPDSDAALKKEAERLKNIVSIKKYKETLSNGSNP